ncbi:peptidyl-prolyl cis-trans isomerase [Patulibacter americanus]|uniref:peptidyl-prolyl cis-trans isomerase n=1 Tax=Patulibacter americanus TaxID=588672 RepID=UPI000A00B06B|nr:peptidyl-prolyl cis-trans isomerase [Patulibacter americanus]
MPRPQFSARAALLSAAVVPTAMALAGCGGGLSADAVAKVDGNEVTKTSLEQMEKLQLTQISQQLKGGKLFSAPNPTLVSFKAPFTECVTLAKKVLPKEQRPADAALKQTCAGIPKQSKEQALQALIVTKIADGEAEEKKVTASDADIKKGKEELLTALGAKGQVPKLLKLTGASDELLTDQAKTTVLLTKVQEKIRKDASKVTDADVQAAYDKNKAQYAQPESRELHVVLTKTEAQAEKAKKAVEDGDSFASVAKKYSIDQVTKSQGGKLTVAKGQQEAQLEKAAFAAKKGEVAGPVKSESGYYVLQVDKVVPAKQIPFAQVKTALKQQLQTSKPAEALQKWTEGVTKEWKAKTECREGYNTIEFCKNAPKPTTTTGAAGAAGAQQGQ